MKLSQNQYAAVVADAYEDIRRRVLSEVMPQADLTDAEVRVISDALDCWRDKDRHGELEREYGYDRAKRDALSTASEKVDDEAKRRGVYWT
ncbi:hypothetical protein ABZZ79_01425 [Streptomyces sp. NPDC006458]|uniref:hypothetical protein n=1 Tax=Streptomyces sp. NPDC006458 TaxID=3154302 RepID=UPI0033A29475